MNEAIGVLELIVLTALLMELTIRVIGFIKSRVAPKQPPTEIKR